MNRGSRETRPNEERRRHRRWGVWASAATVLLWAGAAGAVEQKTNPITSYAVTLFNAAPDGGLFGWIQLKNGAADAGYVYLQSGPYRPPHLSAKKTYIVMEMPYGELGRLLTVLDGRTPLQISFFDPQTAGTPASASIETRPEAGGAALKAMDAEEVKALPRPLGHQ